MRSRLVLGIALLFATLIVFSPLAAWAGGTGPDSCPAGDTTFFIPDDSTFGIANANLLAGGHGSLAPAYLPAGQYRILAEGDLGPADSPPNAPYLALCRDSQGKHGKPVLATAQGHAWANYEVPLAYMVDGAPGTTWLPAGMYRGISSDSTKYGTVQRVAGPPTTPWWQYALLTVGIVAIVACVASLPILRRRSRRTISVEPRA